MKKGLDISGIALMLPGFCGGGVDFFFQMIIVDFRFQAHHQIFS